MKLRWPDENSERRDQADRDINNFIDDCRNLPGFQDAALLLAEEGLESRTDIEAIAGCMEQDYPHIAARVRTEDDERWLRTADALLAEASIQSAHKLGVVDAVVKIGRACGTPISDAWIADALRVNKTRKRVIDGLEKAFRGAPTFIGEGKRVDEVRETLVQARKAWADPSNRVLREVQMSFQWSSMMLLVEPIHALIAPLFDAAAEEALQLIDTMPSPADAVLVLELVRLGTDRFERWARAVSAAPTAWGETGWVGSQQQKSSGLVLPILLWQAKGHLFHMAEDVAGVASPKDVANVIRGRADGAMTAWRWAASLLERADRDDRDGRARPLDGSWRTVLALASLGGWDEFDPGQDQDALLLEATQRVVPGSAVASSPPRLCQMLPSTPEEFIEERAGGELSRGASGLVSGLGLMFDERVPYGTATRILSTGLFNRDGVRRFKELWSKALVLRELAAGGVASDLKDHRRPDDVLHLIIALGLAAIEMSKTGSDVDADGLAQWLAVMLDEIRPWDAMGYETLNSHFQKLRS